MYIRWIFSSIFWLTVALPVSAESLQVTHFLTARWATGTEEGTSQMLDLAWRPEFQWRFEDGSRLTGITRLRFQPERGMRPADMERDSYSPISNPALINDSSELELRELYYQHSAGEWHLTLGKQQVVWGKADGLKVLDVINPQSFREFILEEFDQSRIPRWTLNAERPLGNWTLQLLWLPDQTYHSLAKPGSTYAFTSPRLVPEAPPGVVIRLEDPERPTDFFADSDIGLRLTSFLGGWDISLNYLYQYYNQPALHQRLIPGPSPVVVVTPRYHRTHVMGGSFSRAFGSWVMRGELGYFSNRFFLTTDSANADGVAESPELSYVLGLDWSGIDNTFISAQLFQSWLPDHKSAFARPKLDTTLTFLARRELWNDTLTAEVLWIVNTSDGDGLVRPKVSYLLKDGVKVWAGLEIFYGNKQGLFGEFDRNDRFLLGVEMGF